MLAEQSAREVRVAGEAGVKDALMLGFEVARERWAGHKHAPVTLRLLVEQRVEAVQPG